MATARRSIRGPGVWRALLGLTLLAAIGAGAATLTVDPLAAGSTYGPDPIGLLATTASQDDPGLEVRSTFHYRFAPGGSGRTFTTVANRGPLPISVLGPGDPPPDAERTSLVWAAGLSTSPWPDFVGPDDAPPLDGAVIEPGRELGLWITWQVGSGCSPGETMPMEPGSGIIVSELPVRWSILGVPRTSSIRLRYDVAMDVPVDAPRTICPSIEPPNEAEPTLSDTPDPVAFVVLIGILVAGGVGLVVAAWWARGRGQA